jgi:hypothetical protein
LPNSLQMIQEKYYKYRHQLNWQAYLKIQDKPKKKQTNFYENSTTNTTCIHLNGFDNLL